MTLLDDKDIIQVDATMFAGILILLTLSNIAGEKSNIINLVLYVSESLIPFSISALFIITKNTILKRRSLSKNEDLFYSYTPLYSTGLGFFIIIYVLLVYVMIPNLYLASK
ncbi:MAG TPA: hypothetical protein VH796_13310 [Nitrososphaeraceae archaeon]|jgi:hypothetical protein